MHWDEGSFPHPPQGKVRRRTVRDAYLTPVEQGPLHVLAHPDQWFTGAVHNKDGRLMRGSVRTGGLGGNRWVAADRRRTEVPRRRRRSRLRGRWLYGGTWFQHFGHFLIETLSTLWPDPADIGSVDGLVFHRGPKRDPVPTAWQEGLVALAGYGGLPVHIVTDAGVHVDELVLPSRAMVYNGWAHPEVLGLWQRVAAAAPDGPPVAAKLFLSRSAWHDQRRGGDDKKVRDLRDRDEELDGFFAARGFEVVAPETFPIIEQVRRVRGADVLAGPSGSALHLAMFARQGTRVLELGDSRSPRQPLPSQRVIDTICGHRRAFAPRGWDLDRLGAELEALGLGLPPAPSATRTP